MVTIFILFGVAFIVAEAVSYLVYRSRSLKGLRDFYETLLKKRSGLDDVRTFSLRYAEHPFLAMTSDPEFRNALGEKIHNEYGFRHTGDFSDIDPSRDIVIYCTGGSSTYCNFIERNAETWPGVLEQELGKTSTGKDVRVINGSCSGWTSFQSLIRFTAWVDVLKPHLLIIYHGKNDFSPFVNGSLAEEKIHPDYGNVMHSLKLDSVAKSLPFLARYTFTGKVLYGIYINRKYANVLWHIYGRSKPVSNDEAERGLARVKEQEWEFIISRYRSFKALCKERGIALLFVLQKVESQMYKPYMEKLNDMVRSLESRPDNIFVYDFATEITDTKDILYDSVHFTHNGAKICAGKIAEFIRKNIVISELKRKG